MSTELVYPKGTTKEQWDQYVIDCARHKAHMELKKIHFEQAISCIKGVVTQDQMLQIARNLSHELQMSDSCDAPNKPGYYRANND